MCIGSAEKLNTGPLVCGIQLGVSSEAFAKGHLKVPAPGLGEGHIYGRSFLLFTTRLAVTGHPGMQVSWERLSKDSTAQL